jgi:hypothetical protein
MLNSILRARLLVTMLAACLVMLGGGLLLVQRAAAVPVSPVIFANAPANCNTAFLGLDSWYSNVPSKEFSGCNLKCFNFFQASQPNDCGQTNSDIPGVLLAIIDDLLRIAGLVALGFVFVGAFQFVASRGNSEKTAQAQSTIINALTGLAVAVVAVALVSFLGNTL